LNEAFVVGVPGDAYGSDEVCVRFSFAAADEELKRAVVQIRDAVEKYQENLK
jgi:aspartate/methionine/tyrosine aminotransferase